MFHKLFLGVNSGDGTKMRLEGGWGAWERFGE